MHRNTRGFTLIELMIVIAIIAIIAAIAIPNLLAARLAANETAAIATLRNIVSAQAQFQQSAKADTDGVGSGVYGGFLELSGALAGRITVSGAPAVLVPPVLSGAFRVMTAGEVSRSGYFFTMYLPGPTTPGEGVQEPDTGFTGALIDNDLVETTWCAYAWPVNYNQSGNRTFFTNQAGDVIATEDSTYTGGGGGPDPDAAFVVAAGSTGVITGNVAVGATGNDSNEWRQGN